MKQVMADRPINQPNRTPTADERSFNEAPKVFSKATLLLVGAAILFLIIAAALYSSFFSNATGGAQPETINTGAATNP